MDDPPRKYLSDTIQALQFRSGSGIDVDISGGGEIIRLETAAASGGYVLKIGKI